MYCRKFSADPKLLHFKSSGGKVNAEGRNNLIFERNFTKFLLGLKRLPRPKS